MQLTAAAKLWAVMVLALLLGGVLGRVMALVFGLSSAWTWATVILGALMSLFWAACVKCAVFDEMRGAVDDGENDVPLGIGA